jgi:hypothetical protein
MTNQKVWYEVAVFNVPTDPKQKFEMLDGSAVYARAEVEGRVRRFVALYGQSHPDALIAVRQYLRKGGFRVLHKLSRRAGSIQ